MLKRAVFAKVATIAALLPILTFLEAHSSASASGCSTPTAKLSSVALSSQVAGDRFRLCADWLKVAVTSSGSGAARAPASPGGSGSLPPSTPKTTTITTPLNRSVLATAARPVIAAIPNQALTPDTSVLLFSNATRHSVLRNLLGRDTLIRFTPVAYRWTTGDGGTSSRSRLRHRFQIAGTSIVRLSVEYGIEVRVVGRSGWIKTPFHIKKVATPYVIRIGQRRVLQGRPVFVIYNCIELPSAIGCRSPTP